MFRKKFLRIVVIKHMHKSLQKNYVDRSIIYKQLNTHYY